MVREKRAELRLAPLIKTDDRYQSDVGKTHKKGDKRRGEKGESHTAVWHASVLDVEDHYGRRVHSGSCIDRELQEHLLRDTCEQHDCQHR